MATTRWWKVTFRGGLSEDAKAALAAAGVIYVAGRTRALPSGRIEQTSHTVLAAADGSFEAIQAVRETVRPFGVFSGWQSDELKYLVYFGVPIADAVWLGPLAERDPRVVTVSDWSPTHDQAEILLQIHALNADEALSQAKQAYGELRAHAHMLPAEPLYAMVSSLGDALTDAFAPVGSDTAFVRHVAKARELFVAGEYDLAIVVAQTSCEVLAQSVISQLVGQGDADEGEPVSARVLRRWWQTGLKRCSLASDDRERQLWNALAGEEIQQQEPWWKDYTDHWTRRNGIVHRGARVTREDAEHSLRATEAFRDYVLGAFRRIRREAT